ncbi:MAG: DUF5009 domain-containing protein [Kangiella sp.]|nr:MAG: DUF5009 domain-containing protein [Kangiella sp.]
MGSSDNNSGRRLLSLDALRGFDMIWILGAEGIFSALFVITGWPLLEVFSNQFLHSKWHGFTFYDLIFPLFIFLSGVTLGLSNTSLYELAMSEKLIVYRKAVKRLLILFFLGIIYNHGWGQGVPLELENIRFASVLFRIGFAWFVCAMIVWHLRLNTQVIIAFCLLVFYWILQQYIPTPDGHIGQLTMDHSWNAWVDQLCLPGISYRNQATDPEGLLSQIPAVVNALCGAFAGRLLVTNKLTQLGKVSALLLLALCCLFVGYVWSNFLPINKTLWTSSFVLVSVGYSYLLLATFYYLFDVCKFEKIGIIFSVIGINSILLYLLSSLFNWRYLLDSLFSQILSELDVGLSALVSLFMIVSIQYYFAKILYQYRVFVRV